jgi:ribosomal-protein-alanine N-acetyltransferase
MWSLLWREMPSPAVFPSDRFPCLRTERLLLRETRPSDRDALHASYSDPEVSGWFLDDPHVTVELVEDILNRFMKNHGDGIGITWAIESRQSGELLGTCGHERVEVGAEGEVGFDLGRAHWGKGLMTEALRAVLTFGFRTMGLQKVVADPRADNVQAIRLLEGLGFRGEPQDVGSSRFVLAREDRAERGGSPGVGLTWNRRASRYDNSDQRMAQPMRRCSPLAPTQAGLGQPSASRLTHIRLW